MSEVLSSQSINKSGVQLKNWFVGFILLVVSYFTYCWLLYQLEPIMAYERIYFDPPNYSSLFKSFLLVIILSFCVKINAKSPSELMLWILIVFLSIPQIVVAACNPIYPEVLKWTAAYINIFSILVLKFSLSIWKIKNPKQKKVLFRLETYQKMIFIVSAFTFLAIILGYAVTSISINWSQQYDRRISFRFQESPFIGAGYLFTWLGGVFEPFLFAIGFLWHKKSYLLLALGIALISFSLNGAKTSAFSWILSLFVLVLSQNRFKSISFPVWGSILVLGNLMTAVIFKLFNNPFFVLLIPRRLGLMPAQITIDYIDWVNNHGFTYFTHNFLKFFIPNESRIDITKVIGLYWSRSGLTNSNVNVWADAYISMGIAGISFVSLAMGFVLRKADNLAKNTNFALVNAVMISTLVSWVNIAFSTSMITNGILLAMFMLILYPSDLTEDTEDFKT